MEKRWLYSFLAFLGILTVTVAVIIYARGYRLDFEGKSLKSTGLLVATSTPDGASVYVDGKLKTATNNTLSLVPGWYKVRISKEGYIPWEKRMRVQGEIVSETNAVLFPVAPTLRPLTTTGAIRPTLSYDGTKLAYGMASGAAKKQGIWVYELTDRPISISSSARQIVQDTEFNKFSKARFVWSYDSKMLMVFFFSNEDDYSISNVSRVYLLDTSVFNEVAEDVTLTYIEILDSWEKERKQEIKKQYLRLKKPLLKEATESARIISWSPDEDMFLYQAKKDTTLPQIIKPALIGRNPTEEIRNIEKGKLYVYDIKEDKNYYIDQEFLYKNNQWIDFKKDKIIKEIFKEESEEALKEEISSLEYLFSRNEPIFWYPDSRHLILVEEEKISIVEFDNTNKATVYSGPFEDNYVFSWPAGRRLVILTNYNKADGVEPNLYAVDLK